VIVSFSLVRHGFGRREGEFRGSGEELAKALDHLRPGDTLVVLSLDRLARSLQDLIAIVADLRRRA
jgi:DNA invertase Pin-like site-specific DNA recombinase